MDTRIESLLKSLERNHHRFKETFIDEDTGDRSCVTRVDHGVGSTDHFSALKIWMFENKFVSLPSHLKTIEPMEVHRGGQELCVIQKLQK